MGDGEGGAGYIRRAGGEVHVTAGGTWRARRAAEWSGGPAGRERGGLLDRREGRGEVYTSAPSIDLPGRAGLGEGMKEEGRKAARN